MSDIYLYKNQLWLPIHDFKYTGEPEEFTLNPGKYLFICQGAKGGKASSNFINRGGSSYGTMNLEQTTKMYALVGGNGEDAITSTTEYALGGYNGGGNGGLPKPGSTYRSGAGGGGASDVRLTMHDTTISEEYSIPDEFEELEYIENNQPIAIRTGILPLATTDVEVDTVVYQSDWATFMYMFGCRNGGPYGSNAQCFEFKIRNDNNYGFYWFINTGNKGQRHDGIYGERIQVKTHGSSVNVSQNGEEKFTITSTEQRVNSTINNYADIIVFNCNQGTNYSSNDGGADPGHMRVYSFKVYQNGELSNYFIPCQTKNTIANVGDVIIENGNIVTDGNTDSSTRVRTKDPIRWDVTTQPRQIQMFATDINGEDLQVNMLSYDQNGSLILDDYWYDSGHTFYTPRNTYTIRFCIRYSDNRNIDVSMVKSFSFKYANGEVGLYDVINGTFHPDMKSTSYTPNMFSVGNVVAEKTVVTVTKGIPSSLLSRIIVAGGGGGGTHISGQGYSEFAGFGGGVNGGYPYGNISISNNMKEPTQTSGYKFGYGQNADNRTSGDTQSYGEEGLGGGGGGWYGGYSPNAAGKNLVYSQVNGGGGSGYVYTESSYKPERYMHGYEDRNDLKFIDIFMDAGSAEESQILICQPVSLYNTGDKIICPCVGEGNRFTLLMGSYTVKCYGGSGATRYTPQNAGKGGYAQGTFNNPEVQDVFAYVGGSGLYTPTGKDATFTQTTFPTLCFNGGGNPASFGSGIAHQATAAGGGTDLRIGTDSLLARIIVAGGGGGTGRNTSHGGAGGGSTGGDQTGASYGTNYGPGTQSTAGAGSDAIISGGFGYGGNGVSVNSGYGGAGGGGWYGGSGTLPDNSDDDDRAGCGGSGYVYTESSYKPEGYLLDERYYMSDTTLIQGGNDLPIGITKMVIECIEVNTALILGYDEDGYKYFDANDHVWKYLKSNNLTVTDFEEHGVYSFDTDEGLLGEYELYTHIPINGQQLQSAKFHVVPPTQTIKTKYYTQYTLTRCIPDADVDTDNVELTVTGIRKGIAEDARIDFTIKCDIKDVPNVETRLYSIQGYTQGKISGYVERKPKEKTLEHIDLLPVGTGNRMPSRYKSYIGGFINGTEAITQINSAVCCERNRCIFSATLCNNSIVRFAKLNLVNNTSTIIKDIPKSQLGNTYYGDILVDDDYIYLTSSENDNWRTLWRIALDPNDTTINTYTPGNSSDYNFEAVGRMEWWNDHTIIILARRGLLLFDTKSLIWTWKMSPSQNGTRRDMLVGKKYVISLNAVNSDSAYVCDVKNNEWSTLIEGFNISWAGSYLNCGCYANGKFYVTQQNRLHVVDEATMTLEKSIPTPYTTLIPKTAHYADGIIYITIQNSSTIYIYDTKTDRFYAASLPFTVDDWRANGWIRGVSFRGYFFVPHIRLYTINYVEYAKYNLGYKYDQFIMITNDEEEKKQPYEYDDRFVTFTDSNIWIHTGDITVDMETVDDTKGIQKCFMTKDQYNKFISCTFIQSQQNENND